MGDGGNGGKAGGTVEEDPLLEGRSCLRALRLELDLLWVDVWDGGGGDRARGWGAGGPSVEGGHRARGDRVEEGEGVVGCGGQNGGIG